MIGNYNFDVEGGAHPHDRVQTLKVGDFENLRAFRTPKYRQGLLALIQATVGRNRWCDTTEQCTQFCGIHATIQSLDSDEAEKKFD